MKHVLIQIDPLEIVIDNIKGYPLTREVGDPSTWSSPSGYKYIPLLPMPTEEPTSGKQWVTNLTDTEVNWIESTLETISNETPEEDGISKLTLMKRLQFIGKWSIFKEVLQGLDENSYDAWSLAQEIKASDPVVIDNRVSITQYLQITDQEFSDILDPFSGVGEGINPNT